ncbi:MAG: glycosyltransferase [Rhodothermaceae bacterium TMED105]|nr:MAG: glycosyltransferase [Rhodothermaceae bacterium TMED105]
MHVVDSNYWDYEPLKNPVAITKQKWPEGTKPLVSVCCVTYNHVNFISDMINGILNQETIFPVEIIVYDDASDDGNRQIIEKYAEQNKDLIIPILQSQNQYSLGEKVLKTPLSLSKGRFIALCDGDDYWIDEKKLLKQVSFMESYDVDLCGHPAIIKSTSNDQIKGYTGYRPTQVTKFQALDLINNNGNMLPISSIVMSNRAKISIINNMPPVEFHTGIQLLCAAFSGLIILPDPMMIYRIDVPGSTTELLLGSLNKKANTAARRIESFKALLSLYGKCEKKSLKKLILKQANIVEYQGNIVAMLPIFRAIFNGEYILTSIYIIIKILSINIILITRKIINKKN